MALGSCKLHAAGVFSVFPTVVITNNAVSESKSRKSNKKGKFKSRSRRPSSYWDSSLSADVDPFAVISSLWFLFYLKTKQAKLIQIFPCSIQHSLKE